MRLTKKQREQRDEASAKAAVLMASEQAQKPGIVVDNLIKVERMLERREAA